MIVGSIQRLETLKNVLINMFKQLPQGKFKFNSGLRNELLQISVSNFQGLF